MPAPARKLSPREEAFCLEYVKLEGNGTQAAIAAGYSPNGAHVQAHKLLKRGPVQARILEVRNVAVAKALGELTTKEAELRSREERVAALERADLATAELVQRIQDRLAGIALTPLRDVVTWDNGGVTIRPSQELDPMAAASVAKVKVKEAIAGAGEGDGEELVLHREIELTQHNPIAAARELLELLGVKKGGANPDDAPAPPRFAIYLVGGPTGLEVGAQPAQLPAGEPVAIVEGHGGMPVGKAPEGPPGSNCQHMPSVSPPPTREWTPGPKKKPAAVVVTPT